MALDIILFLFLAPYPEKVVHPCSTEIEESINFVQIFDFRSLVDLQVLGCPEHELTISGKCLSVSVSVCVCVTKILWQA